MKVTYRHTNRLSMTVVKNGDVHISVPVDLPKEELDAFIEKNREWMEDAQKRTRMRQEKRAAFFRQLPLDTEEEIKDAVQRMDAIILPLVEKYAKLLKVKPGKIIYQKTISRWAGCRPGSHYLSFSFYLLLLPEWCIEHVVVHELTHLIVPNHSPRFYALMDQYYPRWREARQEAKRISGML